ncbi:hypothetical protein ACA910_019909 [Epithemia clementina (nom. ined.)]
MASTTIPKKDGSGSTASNAAPVPAGGASGSTISPSGQDVHPFARGSVIEVYHYNNKDAQEDWWSEPDSDIDESTSERTVRLCDIIDRAQTDGVWRYYVHYRDFNRRMDEWVSLDRIVSPPSVGNAKARALKKEEERQKRQQQRKQEEEKLLDAPRSRRRVPAKTAASGVTDAVAGDVAGPAAAETTATRRTRLRRKTSTMAPSTEDDATVAASNESKEVASGASDEKGERSNNKLSYQNKKEEVVLSADAITHVVGEHVVATVQAQELDEHEGLDEASLREHEEVTKVKNVAFLELGPFQMETWYFSPLPKELLGPGGFIDVLYCCEFTFRLFSRKSELRRHQERLPVSKRHPPGNEIYRCGNLSMFEVDGLEEKIYSQNLCYIAKLFLDHKTLYFDVDPFLFYVLCEVDDRGFHPVGYYSKEKYSDVGYNLACILTFPAHQRKGYGRFLIAFSYELSKKEEKVGSPEKPMSDLGQQAYKPYWASTILDFFLNQSEESTLSIMDISKRTSIMAEDIVFTLNQLGLLKIINDVYFIAAEKSLLELLAKKYPIKEPRVDPSKLHWTPFLTDMKQRDKFSIHSKKPSVEAEKPPVTAAT